MSYEPTNWKDRVVEKPRTFTMQDNGDGTITLIPAPGTVVEAGTPVNAANLNKLENGLVSHLADDVSQGEIHGLRVNAVKELEYFDGEVWKPSYWLSKERESWADVQRLVRLGLASQVFNIGDQFVSAYDGGEITWEVIGIDVDTPADSNYTHSMTIQTMKCFHAIQFDAPEYTNPNSDRKNYGNNRYIHSAIRQWLNSNQATFQWVSQHQYDTAPNSSLDLYNGAGFLYRLDPELVAVLGAVNKKVARCNYDGGGQDDFSDKVFLLSQKEVGLNAEGDTTGEFVYPYYDGVDNAGRIKLPINSSWWLRSPYISNSGSVYLVKNDGSSSFTNASSTSRISPACVII